MSNRYYYDRHGNYKGCSSDEPPSDNGCGCLIVVFLAMGFIANADMSFVRILGAIFVLLVIAALVRRFG